MAFNKFLNIKLKKNYFIINIFIITESVLLLPSLFQLMIFLRVWALFIFEIFSSKKVPYKNFFFKNKGPQQAPLSKIWMKNGGFKRLFLMGAFIKDDALF